MEIGREQIGRLFGFFGREVGLEQGVVLRARAGEGAAEGGGLGPGGMLGEVRHLLDLGLADERGGEALTPMVGLTDVLDDQDVTGLQARRHEADDPATRLSLAHQPPPLARDTHEPDDLGTNMIQNVPVLPDRTAR